MIKQATASHATLSHEHFILDAELSSSLDFSNRKLMTENLAADLLAGLGMEELGPLQIYDATDKQFPGWSFIQPITTSHISGHYFEETIDASHIHMDIYSCTPFDWKTVMFIIQKHFPIKRWSANFIKRSIGNMGREVLDIHYSDSETFLQQTKVSPQIN